MYRIHGNSLSRTSTRTGADIRDLCKATEIIKSYLPVATANEIADRAKEKWALFALEYTAPKLLAIGDVKAAVIQMREAINCSRSPKVIKRLTRLTLSIAKVLLKKTVSQLIPQSMFASDKELLKNN